MIIHFNYILIVLVKKITLVLHIFVESSKEKNLQLDVCTQTYNMLKMKVEK